MKTTDIDRFESIIQGIGELVGANLSTIALELWFQSLKDYDIDDIERAAVSTIKTRKYTSMPMPAELIEHIGGRLDDRAEVQAAAVFRAVCRVGGYDSVVFDDPVTMAVISAGFGGWNKLCDEMRAEDQKWFLREFTRIYSAYFRQGIKVGGRLPGRLEIENGAAVNVISIGNRAKAHRVLASGNVVESMTINEPPPDVEICGEVKGLIEQIGIGP